MFWRKKNSDSSQCPPVENTQEYIEWLLRHSEDFAAYRATAQATTNRFVRTQSEAILRELEAHADEECLTAYITAGCENYTQNYSKLVDSAGGFQNLPTHIHGKAFPLLVQLRALMYVLHHKYGAAITPPMLAIAGPLKDI